jgi:YbbR domain-containing protein
VSTLFKNLGSIALSLILAVLVWIAAVREQNPPREDDYSQPIPVTVIGPAPGLITTDTFPDSVRLRLLAPESSWANLAPSKFKAVVNLSKLPAGFNDAPIQLAVSDPQVSIIRQTPQAVTVNLQVEQTITLPVRVELMDDPPLGYINRPPVVTPALVSIIGPAALIEQVSEAVSQITFRDSKETIQRSRPVIIRDRDEQLLTGLRLNPAKVEITVPVEQRFGYKDVAVSAVVVGQPAAGYWVSNISVNPARVTIVGNPKALGSLSGFVETKPFNVDQATNNITQLTPLDLPKGVTVVLPEGGNNGNNGSNNAGGVQVMVQVSAIESGQTIRRPITQQGIAPDYTWAASPAETDVILSGPIPRLQALHPVQVQVIVDLFGLPPGVHKVRPAVFLPDDLRLEAILPDTIEITITALPTPTPTITPTSFPSATPAPTQTASPTPPRVGTKTPTPIK